MTLADRIAYERSFSLSERYERLKERAAMFVAWRLLPKRVRMWAIVRSHANLTTGSNGSRHPDTVSAFDLYRAA